MDTATAPATESDFRAVLRIIHARTGMMFAGTARTALESAVIDRAAALGLDSTEAYARFLSVRLTQAEEIEELLDRVGCVASMFFADAPQLEHFERTILPALIEARAETNRLRIWSAACATGEEAYTIAMIVRRVLGDRFADWRVEIVGTDISQRALDRARAGEYAAAAIKEVNAETRDRWFVAEGARWAVHPEIRAMVTFTPQSLVNPYAARRRGPFDAILCRDTLRYFDIRTRDRIGAMLSANCAPDGFLLLSPGDVPAGTACRFATVDRETASRVFGLDPTPVRASA